MTLSFDDVFASSGIFGLEIAAEVAAGEGAPLAVRGYLYGPLVGGERTFALGRAVWRHCVCCAGEPAWPDDVIVVELREPLDARLGRHGDDEREVVVRGVAALGFAPAPHPGLTPAMRLLDAEVTEPASPR